MRERERTERETSKANPAQMTTASYLSVRVTVEPVGVFQVSFVTLVKTFRTIASEPFP